MKKKFKGFTLVELIVVIAIIGVLAAILVPNMMGYVKKSRLSSANSNAKTAHTAITTYVADCETMGKTIAVPTTQIDCSATATAGATGSCDLAVQTALGGNSGNSFVMAGFVNGTDDTEGYFAQWSNTSGGGSIIGQFPNACNDYTAYDAHTTTWGTYNSADWTA